MEKKMNCAKASTSILHACTGKSQGLVSLIEYSDDSIVSKTILDKPAGTVTLFAFDKGQKLSEHTAAYDGIVQVIEGRAIITIAGEEKEVLSGEVIIMPGNMPHSVVAKEKFKMLLTMIRV